MSTLRRILVFTSQGEKISNVSTTKSTLLSSSNPGTAGRSTSHFSDTTQSIKLGIKHLGVGKSKENKRFESKFFAQVFGGLRRVTHIQWHNVKDFFGRCE